MALISPTKEPTICNTILKKVKRMRGRIRKRSGKENSSDKEDEGGLSIEEQ